MKSRLKIFENIFFFLIFTLKVMVFKISNNLLKIVLKMLFTFQNIKIQEMNR